MSARAYHEQTFSVSYINPDPSQIPQRSCAIAMHLNYMIVYANVYTRHDVFLVLGCAMMGRFETSKLNKLQPITTYNGQQ